MKATYLGILCMRSREQPIVATGRDPDIHEQILVHGQIVLSVQAVEVTPYAPCSAQRD